MHSGRRKRGSKCTSKRWNLVFSMLVNSRLASTIKSITFHHRYTNGYCLVVCFSVSFCVLPAFFFLFSIENSGFCYICLSLKMFHTADMFHTRSVQPTLLTAHIYDAIDRISEYKLLSDRISPNLRLLNVSKSDQLPIIAVFSS